MADAPSLSASIRLDTSKLRADVGIAKAQFQDLTKEFTKLSKEAAQTGDRTKLDAFSKGYDAAKKSLDGMTRSLKEQERALNGVTSAAHKTAAGLKEVGRESIIHERSFRLLVTQYAGLGKTAERLGHVLGSVSGGFAGGLFGAGAIAAIAKVAEMIGEANKKLIEMRDLGRETGQLPANIAAAQRIAARTVGGAAEDATKAITQASKVIAEQRTAAGAVLGDAAGARVLRPGDATGGPVILRGGGGGGTILAPEVIRGSTRAGFDLDAIVKELAKDTRTLTDDQLKAGKGLQVLFTNFEKLEKSGRLGEAQLDAVSKALFDLNAAAAKLQVPKFIEEMEKESAKLGPSLDKRTRLIEESQARDARVMQKFADAFRPIDEAILEFNEKTGAAFEEFADKTLPAYFEHISQGIANFFPRLEAEFSQSWATMWENMTKNAPEWWGPFFGGMVSAAETAMQKITNTFAGARNLFSSGAVPDAQQYVTPQFGMAAGGLVRGFSGMGFADGGLVPDGARPGDKKKKPKTQSEKDAEMNAEYQQADIAYQATLANNAKAYRKQFYRTHHWVYDGYSYYLDPPPTSEDYAKMRSDYDPTYGNYMAAVRERLEDKYQGQDSNGGYAIGGGVRGSSDTVPAWLTPGEYVAQRASVDYYGAGVFSALNNRTLPRDLFSRMGFSIGGLVGPRGYADGGMVTGSASGTPVHLHLGSREFITHAAPHIADALVKEARAQSMRSAGIKPSWVS